jgi:hypothetical protein
VNPLSEPADTTSSDVADADFEATGHPVIDESLRALAGVADAPPGEQIASYEATHVVLKETLATIDQG